MLTLRYFSGFDEYSLFPVSLILSLSESALLGDLKITSSVFSTLSKILFVLNQLFNCFISGLICFFRFFTDLGSINKKFCHAKWVLAIKGGRGI